MTPIRLLLFPLLLLCLLLGRPVAAQSILRDAELEAFLHDVSDPIFTAAGLNPASVHMYLLSDGSINAFVTGGQNIFIHSGLILNADHIGQFLGVIAHETCHIACGHRIRTNEAVSNAGAIGILSLVLGAAAIAAGAGDAGLGLLLGGQEVAKGQFLAYSRGQESEADIAGARYLEAAGVSGEGLIEFFDKLRDQEILAQVRQNPYVRTHPLNRERILRLQEIVEKSKYYKKPIDPRLNERFLRLKAKLAGFIYPAQQSLRLFPLRDQTIAARYGRVYAYHKALNWDKALAEADGLIAIEPENPYFYEIKGQVLFESQQIDSSIDIFRKAVSFAPHNALIATALGQALVSKENDTTMQEAIPILEQAVRDEPNNSFAWFNLARAYGWLGKEALANLATAERYYSLGAAGPAYGHARRAMDDFSAGTPEWIRAQDIVFSTEEAAARSREQSGRRPRFEP